MREAHDFCVGLLRNFVGRQQGGMTQLRQSVLAGKWRPITILPIRSASASAAVTEPNRLSTG